MRHKFIAHRGYSALYLENTHDAFRAALEFEPAQEVIGIELDVHATLDGEIIVFHDGDLRRLCGSDLVVSRSTYKALAEAALGSEGFRHQTIPLLRDVLKQVDHKKRIYCEIKVGDYCLDALIQSLLPILEDYDPRGEIVLHSFSCEMMRTVIDATRHLDVKYGYLFASEHMDKLPEVLEHIGKELDYLHPHFQCLLENTDQLCQYGKKFNTWTVNAASDIQELLGLEQADMIEGIISDDISLAGQEF